MPQVFIPAGRLSTKRRDFRSVVNDIRHAVFSVVRFRPSQQAGLFDITPLGSGFFVTSEIFITCWHVIDSPQAPHQAGDTYRLINNITGAGGVEFRITGGVGQDIHLFPDSDLAVIQCTVKKDQAYVAVSYADVPVGLEIGVAGYPLSRVTLDANLNPTMTGLIYRVARGVATAVYNTDLDSGDGHPLHNVPLIEVNFLFVPGNSGGPIFDGETGRALAYVKGFRTHKISENAEKWQRPTDKKPTNLGDDYLSCVHAVYSTGIRLESVRKQLEQFGVTL